MSNKHKTEDANTIAQVNELEAKIASLEDRLEEYRKRLLFSQERLNAVLNSNSWKVTRPIRGFKNYTKRVLIKCTPLYLLARYIYNLLRKVKGSPGKSTKQTLKPGSADKTQKYSNEHLYDVEYISPIQAKQPGDRHTESVDIIICVHNAYEYVTKCIESVYALTSKPYTLIIVDDGSDAKTRDYLLSVAQKDETVIHIRNERGNGYTIAVNMGLKASNAEYKVLLNSDTVVTEGWLDKMIRCARADGLTGIVGPLSNTASWQSVPELTNDRGDWGSTELPDGVDIATMGSLVEKDSGEICPKVPLLNGFCLMVKKSLTDAIGYMDEKRFPKGFGEEDDFCIRAGKAGFNLAVADNTYIYHAQSKSYSDSLRMELCEESGIAKTRKHGLKVFEDNVYLMKESLIFKGIRARVSRLAERERLVQDGIKRFSGKKILFILPVTEANGGANIILSEAGCMKRMGVEVTIYNLSEYREQFEWAYKNLDFSVLYGEDLADFRQYAQEFDAVCSTMHNTVKYTDFTDAPKHIRSVYYVQDFEPDFYEKHEPHYKTALASYTVVPAAVCVTKTVWNAATVLKETGKQCHIIGPSLNVDLFRPRRHLLSSNVITVCAMIRPHSPRRGPEMTLKVFRRIASMYGDRVNFKVYGSDPTLSVIDDEFYSKHGVGFQFTNYGLLRTEQVAALFNESDIFVDFSTYQAMGLSAMEAMACGCATIVTCHGGPGDFAEDGLNSLLVDTNDEQKCFEALRLLIEDDELRTALSDNGVRDMCRFYPEKSAYKFLERVFG